VPKHLQNDLEHLHRALLRLAGYVEEAVITATSALRLRDTEPAQVVIEGDSEIDSLENAIQEE
jgi:phosphate transport system protein